MGSQVAAWQPALDAMPTMRRPSCLTESGRYLLNSRSGTVSANDMSVVELVGESLQSRR